jgi:hypothetical protein
MEVLLDDLLEEFAHELNGIDELKKLDQPGGADS